MYVFAVDVMIRSNHAICIGYPVPFTGGSRYRYVAVTVSSASKIGKEVYSVKFRDLFLPKIAHSDPKKRKEAIRAESDQTLLKKVIENDDHPEVRDEARKRLEELETA